jgi:hypothetical protein
MGFAFLSERLDQKARADVVPAQTLRNWSKADPDHAIHGLILVSLVPDRGMPRLPPDEHCVVFATHQFPR